MGSAVAYVTVASQGLTISRASGTYRLNLTVSFTAPSKASGRSMRYPRAASSSEAWYLFFIRLSSDSRK